MIPWFLNLVEKHVAGCMHMRPEEEETGGSSVMKKMIKVIRSDGLVKMYERPVGVSELMMELPVHKVCRSDSLYIGQKVPSLSPDDQLQSGHDYFLLPDHFFRSPLSFHTLASFFASPSCSSSDSSQSKSNPQPQNALFFRSKAHVVNCQPFHIHKTPSGGVKIRVSEEFLSQILMLRQGKLRSEDCDQQDQAPKTAVTTGSADGACTSPVCTTPKLEKEYAQLVRCSSMHWKPTLETIKESAEKRKKVASFGIKRIRKLKLSNN